MLNLSALTLTPGEVEKYMWDCDLQGVADAQLKKALWGIQVWLQEDDVDATVWNEAGDAVELSVYLRDMLAAGIPKEGEGG